MKELKVLVIGAGIGGLTVSIALRQKGFAVDLIERDAEWSVYGVGIIQQSNSVRAMAQLGLADDYVNAGFGYDDTEYYVGGELVGKIPTPRLVKEYPANLGITRPALQKVLANRAKAEDATIRLGLTATDLEDDGAGVDVTFSNGTRTRYDLVVGADGALSQTRRMIFPDAESPEYVGMSVWRYNLPRPKDMNALRLFVGPNGVGLVPMSESLMYMFVTSPEPGEFRYPQDQLAAAMRSKLAGHCDYILQLGEQITCNDDVVYRALLPLFVTGPWHKGRIALMGDAVHIPTPHLAQGAGMAIEDAIVIADELAAKETVAQALMGYQERRYERCKRIVNSAVSICKSQLGTGPEVNPAQAMREMLEVVSAPI